MKYTVTELQDFLIKGGHQEVSVIETVATIEDCFMELGKEHLKSNAS